MSKQHTCPSIWCDDKCKVTDRDRLIEWFEKALPNVSGYNTYRDTALQFANALIADGWIRKKP